MDRLIQWLNAQEQVFNMNFKAHVKHISYSSNKNDETSNRLIDVIDYIKLKCRGKFVLTVDVDIDLGKVILPCTISNRGANLSIRPYMLKARSYPFSLDGLLNGVADFIRENYQDDPSYLDWYQELLSKQ